MACCECPNFNLKWMKYPVWIKAALLLKRKRNISAAKERRLWPKLMIITIQVQAFRMVRKVKHITQKYPQGFASKPDLDHYCHSFCHNWPYRWQFKCVIRYLVIELLLDSWASFTDCQVLSPRGCSTSQPADPKCQHYTIWERDSCFTNVSLNMAAVFIPICLFVSKAPEWKEIVHLQNCKCVYNQFLYRIDQCGSTHRFSFHKVSKKTLVVTGAVVTRK